MAIVLISCYELFKLMSVHDQLESKGLVPIRGSDYLLLGRDSPLKKIPVNIEPKQAFF